jgi:formylglycine-generating enzyme required for sulfatase activity
MTTSFGIEEMRAAIADLSAGNGDAAEFEALVTRALSDGSLTPEIARTVLHDGIASGVIDAATLERLGLESVPSNETLMRVSPPAPARDVHTRVNEARVQTQWADPQSVDASSGPIETGHLLGHRYRLERELGAGGMGTVYLASDTEVPGELFAVKVVKPEIREYPESLALLREEVRKTRSLQHPNIVGVYSLNFDHGEVYMLMEYLEGKTLATLLEEDFGRGMPMDRAWPLIQDFCAALGYAHDHNVIHSDLKPANVFIMTSGKAKLLDFGIARAARGRRSSVDPASLGALTPAYASCEMLQGLEPDERDDVYALGCVIYEMLSGKHPFGHHSSLQAREGGLVAPSLAALTRSQNAALVRALAFDRAKRTPSIEEVLAGLEAHPVTRAAMFKWIGGASALLLIALLIGWILWSRQPSNTGRVQEASLARARSLEARSRALGVARSDPAFQEGTRALAEAEKQAAAGGASEGTPALVQAVTELAAANHSGKRFARLGSSADEINLALNLCQKRATPCTAQDFAAETPHIAVLAPFFLDSTGVSNRDFAAFAVAKGYKTGAERANGVFVGEGSAAQFRRGENWQTLRDANTTSGSDPANFPVRGIDYDSAKAYCDWRGKRLPSEDEWEFVARGVDRKLFAWGNDPTGGGAGGTSRRLLPVDLQLATGRFGNHGLGGTLWEWVAPNEGTIPVLRGPSWQETDPVRERLAARRLEDPSRAFADVGFRCAQPVEMWPDAPGFSAK